LSRLKIELIQAIRQADDRLIRILSTVVSEYQTENVEEEGQLYRLVYTSARSKHCSNRQIDKILESSRTNNAKLRVTGILIHTKDRFLQVLEGEKDKVDALYQKIEKDDRHGGSVIRFFKPVEIRYFEGWDMASKEMDSDKINFTTSVSERKKKLYQSMLNGDIHSYKDDGMRVLKSFLLFS